MAYIWMPVGILLWKLRCSCIELMLCRGLQRTNLDATQTGIFANQVRLRPANFVFLQFAAHVVGSRFLGTGLRLCFKAVAS